jgi:hypothetical protein
MRLVVGEEDKRGNTEIYLMLDKMLALDKTVKQTYLAFDYSDLDYSNPYVRKDIEMHNRMVQLFFEQKWDDALVHIVMLGNAFECKLNNFYSSVIRRIKLYKTSPPPKDWDGLYFQPPTGD